MLQRRITARELETRAEPITVTLRVGSEEWELVPCSGAIVDVDDDSPGEKPYWLSDYTKIFFSHACPDEVLGRMLATLLTTGAKRTEIFRKAFPIADRLIHSKRLPSKFPDSYGVCLLCRAEFKNPVRMERHFMIKHGKSFGEANACVALLVAEQMVESDQQR